LHIWVAPIVGRLLLVIGVARELIWSVGLRFIDLVTHPFVEGGQSGRGRGDQSWGRGRRGHGHRRGVHGRQGVPEEGRLLEPEFVLYHIKYLVPEKVLQPLALLDQGVQGSVSCGGSSSLGDGSLGQPVGRQLSNLDQSNIEIVLPAE